MGKFLTVGAAVIRRNGEVLISSRPDGKHQAGFWEFPGGKLEEGETPAACVRRELAEELGMCVFPLDVLADFCWTYSPDLTVRLIFIRCFSPSVPSPREGQSFRWLPLAELDQAEFLPADVTFASWLKQTVG